MTQDSSGAAVAVLNAQHAAIKEQIAALNQSLTDALMAINSRLDSLPAMRGDLLVLTEKLAHYREAVDSAHKRVDKVDTRLAELEALKNRWRGAFIIGQLLTGSLLALIIWVANGYIEQIGDVSDRIYRLERDLNPPKAIEVQK